MIVNRVNMLAALSFCLLATVSNGEENVTKSTEEILNIQNSVVQTTLEDPSAVFTEQQSRVVQTSCNNCTSNCQPSCSQNGYCNSGSCEGGYQYESRPLFLSDHSFDKFIEPVTNFVGAIDPRSRTRVRGVFANQQIPESSILGDGDLQLYAMEASVAINERFAIIAEKDGYIAMQTQAAGNRKGWADISIGGKYVLVRDVENQRLLTAGVMYDVPTGSNAVFQGNNDGIWTMFLTGGQEFANGNAHIMGTAGWRLPNNKSKDTESLYYSLHLDYEVYAGWYALWEFNGILYTNSGTALASPQEGGDLLNLGANNVAGNHVATTALGVTRVFNSHLASAIAYEVPVTDRRDLFDNRVTATITLTY